MLMFRRTCPPVMSGLLTLLTLVACSADNEPPLAPSIPVLSHGSAATGTSQSASGHGNLTVNEQFRTFSFTAVRHGDGEVTGQFELHNHVTGVRLHGRVTCFFAFARPEDPNRGAMFAGGVVTHTDGTVPEGTPVIFNAFDNGEGSNALFPDFLSLMQLTTPEVVQRQCAVGLRITPVLPIEGGNIQIRP